MNDNKRPESKKKRQQAESSYWDTVKGATALGTGGFLGQKAITNGLPGAFGLQTEEHVTSKGNAKKILKDGYLRANKGGTEGGLAYKKGHPSGIDHAKGYVFITGKQNKKGFSDEMLSGSHKRKQRDKYSALHSVQDGGTIDEGLHNMDNGKSKAKVLYTANPESYYNENFKPNRMSSSGNSLKTDQDVKVSGTRLGAMYQGLKEHGLTGMMENKGRAAAYLAGTGTAGYGATKLIQYGYNNLAGNKKD